MDNLNNNNKSVIFNIREKVNNLDDSLFNHYVINNCEINNNNAVSIIMTASNRSKQTYFTLQSMLKSKCKNIQIIIVDDSDIDPININILKNYPYYIDLIVIKRENKNWKNPVVNYNIGFKFIKGDNIVIQNAEVCHVGDALSFISSEMKEFNYYVFDVISSSSFENNEEIYKSDISNIDIFNKPFFNIWYQHVNYSNRNLHFFTSLKRETFNLIKEFSYDYALGIDYDDNDFLLKIISNNINIINLPNFTYNVGGIHLYHKISYECWARGVISNENIFRYKQNYYENNKKYVDCIDFIPKLFFTYWEGNTLTKLHYYTIKSLIKYNPDISIIIYTSKFISNKLIQWESIEHRIDFEPNNSYISLNELVNINNEKIKLVEIDFENEYNVHNNISYIYKADFIRIAKLYEHGGLWFDMDILFINKIPDYFFYSNIDIFYYYYIYTIPTGLLCSTPKNKLITKIYEFAYDLIKTIKNEDEKLTYQKLGPDLWNHCFYKYGNLTNKTLCLDKNTAYAYDCDNILDFFNSNKQIIDNNTFCIHWYNGDPKIKKIINNFDENVINPNNSIFERVIYDIIN
jgi:hypothetical protein